MNFWNNKESNYLSSDFRSRNFKGKWQRHFINKYVDSIFSLGIEEAQAALSDHKNEHLPKSLYKFFTPTMYSLINLQNQQLYLSNPRSFNDPFDSYVCIEDNTYKKYFILNGLKKKKMISKDNSPDTISETEYWKIFYSYSNDEKYNSRIIYSNRARFDKVIRDICKNKNKALRDEISSLSMKSHMECSEKVKYIRNIPFKITCFSNFKDDLELGNNTTMWSHYTDNHQGFCIKYSTNFESLKFRDIILCGLYPVIYTSKVPSLSPRELIKLKYSGNELELNKPILKTAMKALITKSRFWNYEKEWRLIINNEDEIILSNNTIPFIKVESIYIGCRIEDGLRRSLVQFAELNGISIFEAKQNNERFELYFYPVTSHELKQREYYDKLHTCNRIEDINERRNHKIKLETLFNEKEKSSG